MVLDVGDRIHVVTRRQFEEDLRRHFVGEVLAIDGACVRVQGFSFALDARLNQFVKRAGARTKIFGIADSGQVVTVLPDDVSLKALEYRLEGRRLILTDGADFEMDFSEFGAH